MCHKNSRYSQKAFTLAELLVVVLILGILAAILIASFQRARDNANRAACTGNLRQLVAGLVMYGNENNGWSPSPIPGDGSTVELTAALRNGGQWVGLGRLYSDGYVNAPKAFYCPGARGPSSWAAYAPRWGMNAGMDIDCSYQLRTGDDLAGSGFKLMGGGQFSGAGTRKRIGVITDMFSRYWVKLANHAPSPDGMPYGYNVAYNDGSVKWLDDRTHEIAKKGYVLSYWWQVDYWLTYADPGTNE